MKIEKWVIMFACDGCPAYISSSISYKTEEECREAMKTHVMSTFPKKIFYEDGVWTDEEGTKAVVSKYWPGPVIRFEKEVF